MLPGKTYRPEDYLQMAWSRRWIVLLPFVLVLIGAVVYAQLQPNRYRAQTAILIVPQQVPQDYVQSTVTTVLADRLQMISQQILSRTRLERVIQEFDLYRDLRRATLMEDVVEQMRKDIGVNIPPNRGRRTETAAFTVSYESENPRTALLVTERLASLFIRENLEDRAVLADATSQFLDTQLEDARRRLIDQEQKLEDYKRRNAGSLPTQVQANLQAIQTAQMQLQALQEASNRDRDRRLFLERARADAQEAPPAPPTAPPWDPAAAATTSTTPSPGSVTMRLEAARAGLRALELRLKPDHPDVQRTKRVIRDLEKEAEAETLARPVSEASEPASAAPTAAAQTRTDIGAVLAERNRLSRIAAMQTEIKALDRRLEARQADEHRLRGALSNYQARVEAAPARETELVELMRDYDTLKESYNQLLRKSETSKLSVNLERRQIGEQFKIVDAARLPERPVSPNRPRIIGMGAMLGLGLGLALALLLEYRDSSLKTDSDVLTVLTLPVLALVPAMTTKAEARESTNRRRLIMAVSIAAFVMAAGAAAWKLRLFDRWIG